MKQRNEKRFLKLPQYPGGNKAYQEFIRLNLKYPQSALEKRIGGLVYIEYDVTDNGDVINPQVTKGLGYGCDEEALRLVSMLQYAKVKNHGLRLQSRVKTRIEFRLPPLPQINISYSQKPASDSPKPSGTSYGYTIKIPKA
jgi:TonB family protein